MNSSLLRSDRATHLKIGVTAALATALVIVIGICAQPPGAAHGPAVQSVGAPTVVAKVDRGLAATR
jgi:hypothetical protein